ncbi:hypothetical protein CW714_08220 [Methanophagales archaeon]|nr:MAG: hypothetical protein CW714_08220 [Methanophagales archaeon]
MKCSPTITKQPTERSPTSGRCANSDRHAEQGGDGSDNSVTRKIIEKLDKAEEELKSGQKAVSLTDLEARFMKNKKERIELSYNPQITVDHDSGGEMQGNIQSEDESILEGFVRLWRRKRPVSMLPDK